MLSEYIQDLGHNLLMVFNHVSVYKDIIHVNCHIPFIDEVFEDVVHPGLEGGWTIGEAKEHDQRFEEALIHSEGGFPLTSLFDLHIVVSPMYIQFHKVSSLGV